VVRVGNPAFFSQLLPFKGLPAFQMPVTGFPERYLDIVLKTTAGGSCLPPLYGN